MVNNLNIDKIFARKSKMKNNLLKFIGIVSVFLFIDNVYACDEFWSPGCSNGSRFNVEIQNDTPYTLQATDINRHPNHPTNYAMYFQSANTTQTIMPGQHVVFPVEGNINNAYGSGQYSPGKIKISAQVSTDQITKLAQFDKLTPLFYAGFQTCSNVNPNSGSSSNYPCNGQWTSVSAKDSWVIDPTEGVSAAYLLGISRNVHLGYKGNNVIYDYTLTSSQPSNSPPPGSNPFAKTQYAPSPYQHN